MKRKSISREYQRMDRAHRRDERKCRVCGLTIHPGQQAEHLSCALFQLHQRKKEEPGGRGPDRAA